MTAQIDFAKLFTSVDVTVRKPVVRKPTVRKPVANTGSFKFDFSAVNLEQVQTSHRSSGRPVKEEKKFARETFWNKYTKEGLALLRDAYGTEAVNHAMTTMTLEEMGKEFDLDALELKQETI